MRNLIWANPKTQSFVYRWLHAHAMFDVMCFPAFVGALDVMSCVLLICELIPIWKCSILGTVIISCIAAT